MTVEQSSTSGERDVVITRTINAPREAVFAAWTDPVQVAQWFGPRGFTSTCEIDLRVGGTYRITMRGPDGVEYPLKGIYREITPPSRLVYTDDPSDHPASWHELIMTETGGVPAGEQVMTVTFDEHGGKTTVTIHTRFGTSVERDAMVKTGMHEGWGETLDKLGELMVQQ